MSTSDSAEGVPAPAPDLAAAVETLKANASAENTEVQDLVNQLSAANAHITDLQNQVNTFQGQLANAAQAITDVATAAAAVTASAQGGGTPPAPVPEPPAPTPPAPPAPGSDRSVYTFSGDAAAVDQNVWPLAPVSTTDQPPKALYYYVDDVNPGDQKGNGLDGGAWQLYTGTTQPAATASP